MGDRMSNAIVPGSLSAVAKQDGKSLAESFLSADAIVLVDVSASMQDHDAAGGELTRWDAAKRELERLQASLPGRIAVVSFANEPQFCWGGTIPYASGGTHLVKALRFIKPADGCGMRIILISDGAPFDPSDVLALARTFETQIDCVYIGPKGDSGEMFLRSLAAATGGKSSTTAAADLAPKIAGLLSAA
jgi:hypothetical protein